MMVTIISHRGGALLWPENSRLACENTVALGVDQLQVDVHLSRDGEIVVIHDATLDRTTDGTGAVGACTWPELSRLRLKETVDERILKLQEVTEIIEPSVLRLRLELKQDVDGRPYDGFIERLNMVLHETGFRDRTIVTAFRSETLAAMMPGHCVAWLIDGQTLAQRGLAAVVDQAIELGFPTIGMRWSALDPDAANVIRASGLYLCCFGCNDSAAIDVTFALGADEMMTDRPDLALKQRDAWAMPARLRRD
jgi:glycerophosphoryl diester phosphodiesterase